MCHLCLSVARENRNVTIQLSLSDVCTSGGAKTRKLWVIQLVLWESRQCFVAPRSTN